MGEVRRQAERDVGALTREIEDLKREQEEMKSLFQQLVASRFACGLTELNGTLSDLSYSFVELNIIRPPAQRSHPAHHHAPPRTAMFPLQPHAAHSSRPLRSPP